MVELYTARCISIHSNSSLPEQPERDQEPVPEVQAASPPVMVDPATYPFSHEGDEQVVVAEPLETDPHR